MVNYSDELRRGLNRVAFFSPLGAIGIPDWTGEWLGVPMFFSSHDAETNRELLRAAGFELLLDEIVESREPEGRVKFLWILAHKARCWSQ